MTSFTKVWVVVSLIRSGTACGAGPPPCSIIVTVSSPDVLWELVAKTGLGMAPVLARPGRNFSHARWRFGDKIQSPQAPPGTVWGSFEKWLESLRDPMAA